MIQEQKITNNVGKNLFGLTNFLTCKYTYMYVQLETKTGLRFENVLPVVSEMTLVLLKPDFRHNFYDNLQI